MNTNNAYKEAQNASSQRYNESRRFRRVAIIAAKQLTELLGVPHIVVEQIDPATGEKTFQPVPQPKE